MKQMNQSYTGMNAHVHVRVRCSKYYKTNAYFEYHQFRLASAYA